jgi:hypothetical protein
VQTFPSRRAVTQSKLIRSNHTTAARTDNTSGRCAAI